jgi:hypothetical protein
MAKKSKKHEVEQSPEQQIEQTEASNAPVIPKRPTIFLRDENGVEYKFDKRLSLPKKAAVVGEIFIEGEATPFQVTSNKGFTKEDTVINYSWFTLPNGDMGYITHDYGVVPTAGVSYTLHEGKPNRANPARIPKDDVVGAQRVEKFKATMAARKAQEEPAAA